ncbi:MAG: hypothetical protein KF841_04065 [Phycisphaerae bacterium]|nr:hypothetical protein [Phycisphaerae bacterium]
MGELTPRLNHHSTFLWMRCAAIVAIAWHCDVGSALAQPSPVDPPPTGVGSVFTDDGKVILRGQQFEIMPAELLRARGMEYPNIPIGQNAAWKLVGALNQMKDCPAELDEAFAGASGGDWPEGETGVRLKAWLDENAPAIATARDAVLSSQFDMPMFRGDSDMMLAALLPTLGHSRQLARIMAADATYRLANGDAEAALDRFLTIQRLGNHIGNGRTLIEGLVGFACGGLAETGMMRVVASEHADAQTLKAALEAMNELQATLPRFEPMLRAEQKWSTAIVDDLIDYGGWDAMATNGGNFPTGQAEPSGWSRLRAAVQRIYLPDRAIKRNMNEFFDAIAESSRSEDDTPGETVDEELLFRKLPAWDRLTRMMLPSLARTHFLSLRAHSNFARTRLSIAVEVYRKEKGVYPSSLSQLVPRYLAEVPYDPITGYDFDYAPPTKSGERPSGIGQVGRDDEALLMKKRRTPVILTPRASKWRRYVISFANRHEFSDSQRAAAESILRDIEARAAAFEHTQGQRLRDIIESGDEDAAKAGVGPLDELFTELKRRLETLPTAGQRANSKSRSSSEQR